MNEFGLGVVAFFLTAWCHAFCLGAVAFAAIRLRLLRAPATRELVLRVVLLAPLITASVQFMLGGSPFALSLQTAQARTTARIERVSPVLMPSVRSAARAPRAEPESPSNRNEATSAPVALPRTSRTQWSMPDLRGVLPWMGWAWLAMVLFATARLALALRACAQRAARLPAVRDAALEHAALDVAARLGARAPVLKRDDALQSPVALVPNTVIVPQWLSAKLNVTQRQALLAHEIAHHLRGDPWWRVAYEFASRALPWRAARWARTQLDELAEWHCDAHAAALVGQGRALAECLALCAERGLTLRAPRLVAAMADARSPLVARAQRLIEENPMSFARVTLRQRVFAGVALSLAVLALPGVQVRADAAEASPVAQPAPRPVRDVIAPRAEEAPVAQATPAHAPRAETQAVPRARGYRGDPPAPPEAPTPPTPPTARAADAPAPPAPPATPSVPAVPAPPAPPPSSRDGVSLSVESTDAGWFGKSTNISYRTKGYALSLEADGEFAFNDAETDVAKVDDELEIEEETDDATRRIEFENVDGQIVRRYSVDGDEQAFDASAQAWLAQLIPQVLRQSGINAEERVARIHARGGADAVLNEIDQLVSDYAGAEYLSLLFGQGALSTQQLDRAVAAAARIESDYEIRRAFTIALERQRLNDDHQIAIFNAAGALDSDYERRELLISGLPNISAAEAVRDAWFEALDHGSSDYEHRVAIEAAFEALGGDEHMVRRALTSVEKIDSDYERRMALQSLAPRVAAGSVNVEAYARAATGIGSDYELRQALSDLVARVNLDANGYSVLLDAAAKIDSDYECRELLIEIAERMPEDATLIAKYRSVARSLGSYERGEAEQALDRFDS
jgi:beta-lactamase regulating signal transducer with metallopeptidase domain